MEKKAMQAEILVVDDKKSVIDSLTQILNEENYKVIPAKDDEEALYYYAEFQPDMIILDICFGYNERMGLDILKEIRVGKNDKRTPIIMLTGLSEAEIEWISFDWGATDFVKKSTSTKALLARIRNRLPFAMQEFILIDNQLKIDPGTQSIKVNQNNEWSRVRLEPLEYKILMKLAKNPGQVILREVLENYFPDAKDPSTTLSKYISELRKKLEPDLSNPRYILTKRSVGYWFKDYR
jgi:DNA-binding response OmpR family regulator